MAMFYASLFSLFTIVVSCLLRFAFFKSKSAANINLPPGRRGWPVIGETVEFVTAGWKGHPEKFIVDRMKKFSHHVFRTSLMLEDAAVFCGPEGNKFLFSNENKLVRFWLPASARKILPFTQYCGDDIAKMVRYHLKPETIRQYVPIIDMVAQKHFETRWEGKDQILTHETTKNFTFLVACKIFFSIDEPEWVNNLSGPFKRLAPGLFSIPINLPGTPFRRAINARTFIGKELTAIVKQRKIDLANGKASPTQDILSLLLGDDYGKYMADTAIADLIIGLMIGGYDSTSSTCTFIVNYLAELPEIYEKVYKEQTEIAKSKTSKELLNWDDISKMKYSWNVVSEVLRLVPPTQGTFREAICNFTFRQYSIPKGWKLYWSTNSTHKNPNFFLEPEKFDPSRFDSQALVPYTYVPFGGGCHLCPGKEFARVELLVFIHHLVRKFKLKKIFSKEDIIFDLLQPKLAKGLPIHLYPHKL
uniref:Cytochrome P450 monooxygenase CYP716A263 n=1 Tax=Taraxacum kok-saghyz TaxID=333970 RepID=A0A3S5GS06_TARKO|nr:cytochrome P450 monooxygenase CYP716A263 [Taraxacum kok-saghyz]